jgi:hypothetical protein
VKDGDVVEVAAKDGAFTFNGVVVAGRNKVTPVKTLH